MQDPLIGEVLSGTYRIERLIGRGSMGTVYEAAHLRLPRRFAVKILITALSPEQRAVARFQQEAEVTSQLGHPNIVEVLDFNYTTEGLPFIVMELLSGEDLGTRLERVSRLEPAEAEAILEQVASALTATHDKGVVHRDLKPQNIFLCRGGDGQERVKVVDFGISKVLGQTGNLTTADMVVGTPFFMSPEQALGKKELIDGRTDVFAMGVILYTMLTGELPFDGEAIPNILYNIVHGERPSLLERCPGLPVAVEQVVARSLAADPAARQQTMAALHQEFVRALHLGIGPAEFMVAEETAQVSPLGKAGGAAWSTDEAATTSVMPMPSGVAQARAPGGRPRRGILMVVGLALLGGIVAFMTATWEGPPSSPGTGVPVVAPAPVAQPDSAAPPPHQPARSDLSPPAPLDLGQPPAPRQPPPDLRAPDQAARARPAPWSSPASRRRHGPAVTAVAYLTVTSRFEGKAYWAHVLVDGKKRGDSPLHRIKVTPGKHRVAVSRPGFRGKTVVVSLKRGEHTTVTITLQK